MSRTAIIAAMPGELKPLVRGWQHERRGTVDLWRRRCSDGECVAACAGAGAAAATRAFAAVERDGAVDRAISTGWVGALDSRFLPGTAYRVAGVIDTGTGERFEAARPVDKTPAMDSERDEAGPLLATSLSVAGQAEKARLAAAYGAGLVDMEAAAVARLAQMRKIPFLCIKGVSDGLDERLPDLNHYIAPDGSFRLAAFVLFAILRPWYWPALMRMGENSKKAAREIAELLLIILDIQGEIRERNGYPGFKR